MSVESLDRQFDTLPKEVVFCKNCVVSNQRPRTRFNKEGICSACQWAYEKDHTVDWEKRERELKILCDKYRSNDGSYDVVVPGSGGKDSVYVAHQLKHRYGMHPLCVTWSPFEYTDIGWQNLHNFIQSGFMNILGQPDGVIHRKLTRLAFELKGDAWEPFTYGQKAWAFHIACKFGIKLIFYGENGELEYGGGVKNTRTYRKRRLKSGSMNILKGPRLMPLLILDYSVAFSKKRKFKKRRYSFIKRHISMKL